MTGFYQVWFSAETEADAKEILNTLTSKNLIVGGTVLNGPSHFWWDGREIDMEYFYVMGFTTADNRDPIEEEYAKVSREDVPMASFVKMEGNRQFLDFISRYTQKK